MLKRVKVTGYKSLADMDVALGPLCVLFGPNAAGKSNFLDALQLLSRVATSRNLKDAFEPPYRGAPLESFAFGKEGLAELLKRDSVSLAIEADVELSQAIMDAVNRQIEEMRSPRSQDAGTEKNGESAEVKKAKSKPPAWVRERNLRYRIEIEILPKSGILRVADEYLAALGDDGKPIGRRTPFLERKENRLHLRMEGQAHPTYYERYLNYTILSQPLYPPHYPHLVAMRRELESWLFFYFEPRERMRATNPVKEVRHIGMMGEELASFLNTLRTLDERQFQGIERALRLIIPSMTKIDVGVSNLGEVELRLLEGETPIPARILSEGTLRVLGLLALGGARESPALIGFEEPENGIHPRRIRQIATLLQNLTDEGRTQLIVTTHSPTLCDLIPPKHLYVCRRRDGRTAIERLEELPLLNIFNKSFIEQGIDDEDAPSVSDQIMRGDFDA
jgi:predicted ATPase